MKKLLSMIFFAFMATTMFAQSNPYRFVIHQKGGVKKAFTVESVDSVSFKKLESEVGVDVEIKEINRDDPNDEYIVVSMRPTPACKKYRFAVVPEVTSNLYGGSIENMRKYFDDDEFLPTLTEGLEDAYIGGFSFGLLPGIYYTVMVLSYDEFGIPCNAQNYTFQVPAVPIVGNPSVECTINEATANSINITFTPNADCAGYYTCFFEPGLAEKQFKQFGPMMGFACMGDMIKSFGQELHEEEFTITWDQLAAGVDYEVYVQPLDANGNYADMVITTASTLKIGGEGLAEMTIELGEYSGDAEFGYYQEISFIPNDQTAAHRDIVAMKSAFDNGTWTEETLVDYMKHDKNPDYPDFIEDPDWDKYGVHTGHFPVTPGDTYYIYSIGKNINGEYGPFTKVVYTAPDAPAANMKFTADKRMLVKEKNTAGSEVKSNGKVLTKRLMIRK